MSPTSRSAAAAGTRHGARRDDDGRARTMRRNRALAVAAVAFTVFLLLLPVGLAPEPSAPDPDVLRWLHQHRSDGLDGLMMLVTLTGRSATVAVSDVLVLLLTLWLCGRRPALFFGSAVALAAVFSVVAKRAVARPRPQLWPALIPEHSYGFPSGHAVGTMALATALLVLLWRTPWRWPAAIVLAAWVALTGLSRWYLGVHYPSDVLAGWAGATGCVMLVRAWLDPVPVRPARAVPRRGQPAGY